MNSLANYKYIQEYYGTFGYQYQVVPNDKTKIGNVAALFSVISNWDPQDGDRPGPGLGLDTKRGGGSLFRWSDCGQLSVISVPAGGGVVGVAPLVWETKDVGAGRWRGVGGVKGGEFWDRERSFHPRSPGECQAEGDRGLQISLRGLGQCWVFSECLSLTHFEEFLWSV